MCDYSLHAVASRPAKVGERLIATSFSGGTRGFAAQAEPKVAVCLLPGTELAFDQDVKYDQSWIWKTTTNFRVARFRKIDPHNAYRHHDALELPDGNVIPRDASLKRPARDCIAVAGHTSVRTGDPTAEEHSNRNTPASAL